MDKWILRDAERYASAHRRKQRWYQVMTCLAAVVVFCTTYALILPAITLEKQCQIPEHTHTDSCYTQVTSREKSVLACEVEADAVIHKHDAACRDENGNLVCSLPELEAHRHTDSCYTIPEVHAHTDACYTWERGELTCTQSTEPQHIHTEDCYQESSDLVCGTSESTGHAHGAECRDGDGNLICGQTEEPAHQHTDECYSWNQVLTCGQSTEAAQPVLTCEKDEIELHTHQPFVSEEDRGCYDADGKNLVCGKPQVVEHRHTGACFKTVTEAVDTEALTCTLPVDETHTHGPLCYGTWELTCGMEEHTHSEACTPAEPFYKCGLEAHTHSETCYDEAGELTCGLEEHTHSEACAQAEAEDTVFCGKEAHTHEAECWDENGNLVCTLEEHTHSLACYSDPTADVETQNDWQQSFGDVTLTGNWRQDAVAIAKTQLGYTESTANYLVEDDGQTLRGYTRYGAWYGDPYGDWDAMFVSFCLHYAGAEDIPMDKDCGSWVAALADAFIPAQSHEAAPGELVFFDRDGDGTADHVALVSEVTAGEDGAPSGFTAIAGDVDNAVQQLSYAAEDSTILGYVILPEQAKEFTLTAQTETGITVTISGDSASLPYPAREITVTVKEVTDEESIAIRDRLLGEEAAEPEQNFLLDITLWYSEEEIEPTGPVTVTFSGFDAEGLYPKVFHIDTVAQTATDMEAEKEENGDVTVATDHFSVYALRLQPAQQIQGYIENKLANGGEFQLSGNAWTEDNNNKATLTISQDTTIDLNGHILSISKSDQYFEVKNGATLTIKDSAAGSDEVTYPGGTLYGNKASLGDNTLTYYITTSTASGTGTTETLEKHEVNLSSVGRIVCSEASAHAVQVNGGTLIIQGGMLNSNNKGGRVVCVDSGTLTMEDGYLVGGSRDIGGGVYSKGTVNMSGGVIAANNANAGGGIYADGGTVSISGGAVAGNWVKDGQNSGGGIFVASGTLNLSGSGYVTNNYKNICCYNDVNNWHGGGGITLGGSSTMNMSGGYVTGNHSGEAGGGIYAGFYGGSAKFTMSGGTIASNCAEQGEGGGLRIGGGTTGVISVTDGKAYITNNRTNTPDDWGGGGIFVQQSGNLNITNALITANSAGGFGGGVGACPTGETMIVHTEGAAIYRNSASGTNMSDGGNGKNDDSWANNRDNCPVFANIGQKGYQDYFCVKKGNTTNISLVTGEMVGGGAANWSGSCDEKEITISKTGHAAAKYLFGLTSSPDESAIGAAKKAAMVIISGNYSNIHGGGIMTNGGLILGRKETEITAIPALDITAEKVLMVDGSAVSSGRNFQFRLTDSDGKEVGTATADASTGRFTIAPNKKYDKAGTYTYYLTEVNDDRPGVTYDSSRYQIDVTIAEKSVTLMGVTFKSYYVDTVNVTKSGSGGSSSGGSSSGGSSSGGSSGGGSTSSGGTTTPSDKVILHFYNYGNWNEVALNVFNQSGVDASAYTVGWPGGLVSADSAHTGWYTVSIPVTGTSASFNFQFNNNNNGSQTQDFETGAINGGAELWITNGNTVSRVAPAEWSGGSTPSSGVSITTVKNPDGSYSLTINGSAFTNTQVTLLNIQLVKKDSNSGNLLPGAEFLLKQAGQTEGTKITTGTDGIALFTGISRNGIYYLYEQTPPANYMPAGPWIIEVKDSVATMYPATADENGTLTKASQTVTPLTDGGNNTLTVEIPNQPWGYELPNTGGAGTQLYTMGGCALIAVYLLLYSHTRRRKEDAVSS